MEKLVVRLEHCTNRLDGCSRRLPGLPSLYAIGRILLDTWLVKSELLVAAATWCDLARATCMSWEGAGASEVNLLEEPMVVVCCHRAHCLAALLVETRLLVATVARSGISLVPLVLCWSEPEGL